MHKLVTKDVKVMLSRVENMARKQHRTLAGQLAAILELYEKQTGITSKRPYTRKPTPAKSKEKAKPRLTSKPKQLALLDDDGHRTRKVRSDAGKKRGPYKKTKVSSVDPVLAKARKKLVALKGVM